MEANASDMTREELQSLLERNAEVKAFDYSSFGFALLIKPRGGEPFREAGTIAVWASMNGRAALFGYKEGEGWIALVKGDGRPFAPEIFKAGAESRLRRASGMSKAEIVKRLTEMQLCEARHFSGSSHAFTLSFPREPGAKMIKGVDEAATWAESRNKDLTLEYSNKTIFMRFSLRRKRKDLLTKSIPT